MKTRIAVMHGVNLDQLGRRDPEVDGGFTLTELEVRVKRFAVELGFEPSFFQTNHEGEFCEELHEAAETQDGLVLNPGAWTHYSYAIRDALEVTRLPAVEVHISEVDDVLAYVGRDKKRREGGVPFVLVEAPGEVTPGHDVDPDALRAAVEEVHDR